MEAPKYKAVNTATGEDLRWDGETVIGTYTWVASMLARLVSDAEAFELRRMQG